MKRFLMSINLDSFMFKYSMFILLPLVVLHLFEGNIVYLAADILIVIFWSIVEIKKRIKK